MRDNRRQMFMRSCEIEAPHLRISAFGHDIGHHARMTVFTSPINDPAVRRGGRIEIARVVHGSHAHLVPPLLNNEKISRDKQAKLNHHPSDQPINQPTSQPTDRRNDRSTDQPINQPTNQPQRPIDQPRDRTSTTSSVIRARQLTCDTQHVTYDPRHELLNPPINRSPSSGSKSTIAMKPGKPTTPHT